LRVRERNTGAPPMGSTMGNRALMTRKILLAASMITPILREDTAKSDVHFFYYYGQEC
jgi:hypothetical protein